MYKNSTQKKLQKKTLVVIKIKEMASPSTDIPGINIPLCKLLYRPVPVNLLYYGLIVCFTVAYFVVWIMSKVTEDEDEIARLTQISNIILAGGIITIVFLWAIRAAWNELSYVKKCSKAQNVINKGLTTLQQEIQKLNPDVLAGEVSRKAARVVASQIDKIVKDLPTTVG